MPLDDFELTKTANGYSLAVRGLATPILLDKKARYKLTRIGDVLRDYSGDPLFGPFVVEVALPYSDLSVAQSTVEAYLTAACADRKLAAAVEICFAIELEQTEAFRYAVVRLLRYPELDYSDHPVVTRIEEAVALLRRALFTHRSSGLRYGDSGYWAALGFKNDSITEIPWAQDPDPDERESLVGWLENEIAQPHWEESAEFTAQLRCWAAGGSPEQVRAASGCSVD